MPKYPPIIRTVESFRLYATTRMLRYALVLVLAVLMPVAALQLLPPRAAPVPAPAAWQVPPMDWTTDSTYLVPHVLASASTGALPPPGPNQKRAGSCEPGVEEEISGGCWLATDKMPPCPLPRGGWVFFAHEGKCWLPVAHARGLPTTGDTTRVNIAGE